MKYVVGIVTALVTATATIALGDYIDHDMKFLAGWWSCMVWYYWMNKD